MANNTVDTLSIQITSSSQGATKAIDTLISNLTKLNGALENYSSDSNKYSRALTTLSNGLSGLNKAINGIDANNLKDVANSIKSLASAGEKLGKIFGNTGLDKATKEANAMSKAMDKAVQGIMAFYGIKDKSVGKQLGGDLSKMVTGATVKDGKITDMSDEGQKSFENVYETLSRNARVQGDEAGKEFYQGIIDYVRSNKIPVSLPFDWQDVSGDFQSFLSEASTLFGVGGFKFHDTGLGDISEYARQMNEALGLNIDTSNDQIAFEGLYEIVSQARDGLQEFAQATGSVDISINQMADVLGNAISQVQQFQASMSGSESGSTADPFMATAEGIRALQGVQMPDFSNLSDLVINLAKMGGKGATQAISNLPLLAQGLQGLSSLQIPNFPNLESLNELIATFNRLGAKKGTSAASNIKPMVDGLRELSGLTGTTFPDSSQLLSLANAFSALGRETTGRAITNIPQLAQAFKDLMTTLSTAPKVSNDVIRLAEALGKLSGNSEKATDPLKQIENLIWRIGAKSKAISGKIFDFGKNILVAGKNAISIGGKFGDLSNKLAQLYAKFWLVIRAIRALGGMIEIASHLTEVQNVIDTTFGNAAYKVEEFSKNAIKSFGMSELAAKQLASRFQAMGNAMGITGQQVAKAQQLINTRKTADGLTAGYNEASNSVADLSINLTKLAGDMASFYDIEQETVGKALQSGVMAGQTRPLRSFGIDLTNATLAEWAMKNGLDANIKSMTQAEKTMLRYQYVMSQTTASQGDFTRTARRSKRAA